MLRGSRIGANVGPLAGIELGVDDNSVLKVVDAHVGSFLESDGAEMAGNFEAAKMRVADGHFEFVRRDVVVGLEGGDAFSSPVVDGAAGIVGVGELMHLQSECALAFEVGTGDIELGTGN